MRLRQAWTIGHSNRGFAEFLEILQAEDVAAVADVRRFPGSRRCPQFNRDAMEVALQSVGVAYRHFPELGGRRTSQLEPSPNTAWRVEAFRAYADYTLTHSFQEALGELMTFASSARTGIMCAEALPWRCHRRLIADQLIARGWVVVDIIGKNEMRDHTLPPFAKVQDHNVTYPGSGL